MPRHLVGHAAQQESSEAGEASRPHHDQICPPSLRRLEDLLRRMAVSQCHINRDPRARQPQPDPFQSPRRLLLPGLDDTLKPLLKLGTTLRYQPRSGVLSRFGNV